MRRRLQETFHLSPSSAGNGGFFSSLQTAGHQAGQIPSISVSVQTEPCMANLNGNATTIPHTTSLIGNGGGLFQNGVNSNPSGGVVPVGGNTYATLPHPHHHLQNHHNAVVSTGKTPF